MFFFSCNVPQTKPANLTNFFKWEKESLDDVHRVNNARAQVESALKSENYTAIISRIDEYIPLIFDVRKALVSWCETHKKSLLGKSEFHWSSGNGSNTKKFFGSKLFDYEIVMILATKAILLMRRATDTPIGHAFHKEVYDAKLSDLKIATSLWGYLASVAIPRVTEDVSPYVVECNVSFARHMETLCMAGREALLLRKLVDNDIMDIVKEPESPSDLGEGDPRTGLKVMWDKAAGIAKQISVRCASILDKLEHVDAVLVKKYLGKHFIPIVRTFYHLSLFRSNRFHGEHYWRQESDDMCSNPHGVGVGFLSQAKLWGDQVLMDLEKSKPRETQLITKVTNVFEVEFKFVAQIIPKYITELKVVYAESMATSKDDLLIYDLPDLAVATPEKFDEPLSVLTSLKLK
ncbi:hypothetical protein ADUPG1_013368 [Aduncisulcus paluster]|uniref:Uncharacterized protein n=1 Tax=Aduncisulcus paluster TaxID=2918883 RepID=A0ABQ5K2P6_9EUKA|nr:hypothetical protein ADUPG1_013368 [Aduncisulcus paluster]